jgi:hypothetical protein
MGITFTKNYQVYPSFIGTDQVTSSVPFLLPPAWTTPTSDSQVGGSIAISVPYLIASGQSPANYTDNTDFQLTVSSKQIQITIMSGKGTNAWCAGATARTALMTNFTAFLQYVETNYELPGILVPGSTFIIGQAIADWIPAPLTESAFYRYSLSTGFPPPPSSALTRAFVDLRPGMRLRVESAASEYVSPGSPMNGFVGNGQFEYLIGSMAPGGGARVITFDSFMGTISSPKVNGATTTPCATAGGLFDLQATGSGRTYVRLFYPSSVGAPAQPGCLSNTCSAALVGAQTLAMLNQATSTYPTWTANLIAPATLGNTCIIFLGRAVVVPEIEVFVIVRGTTFPIWVSVGTTFANIVQRYIPLPLSSSMSPFPVSLQRFMSTAPTNRMYVDNQINQTANGITASMFDVPLVAGDLLTFSF